MQPGDYADTLRCVGWFLDMVSGRGIEVALYEEGMATSFTIADRREVRKYDVTEVDSLRSTTRLFRGLDPQWPGVDMSHTLRVMGMDLDAMGARTFTIAEDTDSFELLAVVDGTTQRTTYPRAQLQDRAGQMVAGRGTDS